MFESLTVSDISWSDASACSLIEELGMHSDHGIRGPSGGNRKDSTAGLLDHVHVHNLRSGTLSIPSATVGHGNEVALRAPGRAHCEARVLRVYGLRGETRQWPS